MIYDEIKKQLMSRVDDIVNAIVNDKVLEIKKDKSGNFQAYEVKRKNLKSS